MGESLLTENVRDVNIGAEMVHVQLQTFQEVEDACGHSFQSELCSAYEEKCFNYSLSFSVSLVDENGQRFDRLSVLMFLEV